MKKSVRAPIFRVLIFDLIILNGITIFFVSIVKGYRFSHPDIGNRYFLLLMISNLVWILINLLITKYRMEIVDNFFLEIKKLCVNMLIFTGIISIFAFTFQELRYSRIIMYGSLLTFFVFQVAGHFVFLNLIRLWRDKRLSPKKIVIVGTNSIASDLYNEIKRDNSLNCEIVGFIRNQEDEDTIDSELIVGKVAELEDVIRKINVDELFITISSTYNDTILSILQTADYYGIRVRMIPEFYKMFKRNFKVYLFSGIPVINVNEMPLDNYYNAIHKRIFDIFFSFSVLIMCMPLFLIIGLAIKFDSKGPLLYVPERIGFRGKVFKLYKFRTMHHSIENRDKESTKKNDDRITPIGRYLRKYNLDELPQFVNVLKGDMSIIGPRPHRVYLDKVLQESVDEYMLRHYIRPGITGWAQVNGWRGPTETEEQRARRTEHDLWYLEGWTFGLDMKILYLTIFGKKVRENAF